jgi:hypothetical protein
MPKIFIIVPSWAEMTCSSFSLELIDDIRRRVYFFDRSSKIRWSYNSIWHWQSTGWFALSVFLADNPSRPVSNSWDNASGHGSICSGTKGLLLNARMMAWGCTNILATCTLMVTCTQFLSFHFLRGAIILKLPLGVTLWATSPSIIPQFRHRTFSSLSQLHLQGKF